MSNFTPGVTFSDTAPGNEVTAARLHALVTEADLTATAITGKTEQTSLTTGDTFLFARDGELYKADYGSLTSSPVGVIGARNLVIKNNTGSPTTTVDITADEVLMRDSNGILLRADGVSGSANITATGENGRDTGSEAASTWYYIWAINNGTTQAFLLSTSATSPTMPSGYDYKARIGGVYNNASSNLWTFLQNGARYSTIRQAQTLSSTGYTPDTNPASPIGYVTYAMDGTSSKPFVPPNAVEVWGSFGRTDSNACSLVISGSNDGIGAQSIVMLNSGTTQDSFATSGQFNVPIVTAQTVFLKSANASTNVSRITVSGFLIKP